MKQQSSIHHIFFGIFSPIIPDAIKSVDIYKADFPVNYGGRLSSVIDISTKDGNKNHFSATGSLDLSLPAVQLRDR